MRRTFCYDECLFDEDNNEDGVIFGILKAFFYSPLPILDRHMGHGGILELEDGQKSKSGPYQSHPFVAAHVL